MGRLTIKRKAFVDLFLITKNATKAYQEVYKCSYDSANKNSARLMVDDGIMNYIADQQAIIAERYEINREELIQDLKSIKNNGKDRDILKAVELLGKEIGMFQDRPSGEGDKVEVFTGITLVNCDPDDPPNGQPRAPDDVLVNEQVDVLGNDQVIDTTINDSVEDTATEQDDEGHKIQEDSDRD